MENADLEYSKIFYENVDKGFQWRLSVSYFKGNYYLHIRKYFLSFDEGYLPSKEGIAIPYEMESSRALALGLLEILSNTEKNTVLDNYNVS